MKYLRQLAIILLICFIGEILNYLIPLPVPASIYGIVLMFLLLLSGVLKPESIRETARFLIAIMPIMFVAPAVGLMDSWSEVASSFAKYLVVLLVSCVIVMGISGRITQRILRYTDRPDAGNADEGNNDADGLDTGNADAGGSDADNAEAGNAADPDSTDGKEAQP
jgi:holin-like protein